jgi:uncharacterized protein
MTSRHLLVRSSFLVLFLASIPSPMLGAEAFAVKVETGVPVKMRDGVTLRADIYRPDADGKYPVLLQRTPYNKAGGTNFGRRAAARGYVAIIQDVRGRYTSEGDWYTFIHEAEDGYDTIEWAAALPYADGKVGMWGGSYVGSDADAGRHGASSAPRGDLPRGYCEQLSRRVDVPGWRVRAMVR